MSKEREQFSSLKMRKAVASHFATLFGRKIIHSSWRDEMLRQGRDVSEKRLLWETLSPDDQGLDKKIAYDVIMGWFDCMYGEPMND